MNETKTQSSKVDQVKQMIIPLKAENNSSTGDYDSLRQEQRDAIKLIQHLGFAN
jgi:hypothetical protein